MRGLLAVVYGLHALSRLRSRVGPSFGLICGCTLAGYSVSNVLAISTFLALADSRPIGVRVLLCTRCTYSLSIIQGSVALRGGSAQLPIIA